MIKGAVMGMVFGIVWIFGFLVGVSQDRPQTEISILETDHSVETDHHAHQ